jgi:hypothetical protein
MSHPPLDDPDQVTRYRGDTILIDLYYPRTEGHAQYIEVGLLDVRASDGIRVSYDFDRDGYMIEQPWYEEVEITKPDATYRSFNQVEHWQEVGFFRSWALKARNKSVP